MESPGLHLAPMVVLTAYVTIKPGHFEAALAACETVRLASVLEPGCDRYDYFVSSRKENQIVFVEEWSTMAALQSHFQQPPFMEFMGVMGDLREGEAEIRIFDAHPVGA